VRPSGPAEGSSRPFPQDPTTCPASPSTRSRSSPNTELY
jgi:hypothetical protein